MFKAAYKGYYTRRVMKRLVEESQKLNAIQLPEEEEAYQYEERMSCEMGEEEEDEYIKHNSVNQTVNSKLILQSKGS